MKYAVIGTGKTGKVILDMLPSADVVEVFNTRNPVTKEKLQKSDVASVFVPGKGMGELMPILLEARVPLVIGTTGYEWPKDLDARLKELKTPWIIGRNFSIALNVMRYYAERIKKSLNDLRPGQLKMGMSETHHIHKLDAPSGTALYLAEALAFPREDIKSIREGDVNGIHTVSFDWPYDRLIFTHEALDRAAFAEGVIMACAHAPKLAPGLHTFDKLAEDLIEGRGK